MDLGAQAKVEDLERALETRTLTGQATGILMERYDIDAHRALALLRRSSSALGRTLVDVATGLIATRTLEGIDVATPLATDQPGLPASEVLDTMGLSARERQVLALIATGASNEDIAATLFLGINTVKTYIRTAYRKMGVSTRAQAVLWGVENGFYIPALAVRSPSHSGRRSRNPRVDTTRASDLARHVP